MTLRDKAVNIMFNIRENVHEEYLFSKKTCSQFSLYSPSSEGKGAGQDIPSDL